MSDRRCHCFPAGKHPRWPVLVGEVRSGVVIQDRRYAGAGFSGIAALARYVIVPASACIRQRAKERCHVCPHVKGRQLQPSFVAHDGIVAAEQASAAGQVSYRAISVRFRSQPAATAAPSPRSCRPTAGLASDRSQAVSTARAACLVPCVSADSACRLYPAGTRLASVYVQAKATPGRCLRVA